jgi:hypothetical protein
MLRSQYRTHLDLTTLADNKASIMITINGLIISILLATGGSAMAFADNNLYILPIIILLVSGFISMIYAVLSARPLEARCCDAVKVPNDFLDGKANIMYYMDNADLSNDEYIEVMMEIMTDNEQVYREMVGYVHTMSVIIRRKFFLLRTSYFIFIMGLGLCITTFIGIAGSMVVRSEAPGVIALLTAKSAEFSHFPQKSKIYEPSGIVQLRDGRVLVVEDEANQPFSLIKIHPLRSIESTPLKPSEIFSKKGPYKSFRILDDLEGVTTDKKGYVYAVTSHSLTSKNRLKQNRNKLTRFQISGSKIFAPVVVTNMRDKLIELLSTHEINTAENEINIEALSLNSRQDELLLGFRGPLDKNGNALIAAIDNLDALFNKSFPVHFSSRLIKLDLDGNGIRGMAYDPHLQGYLIISGSSDKQSESKLNQLWFWNGMPGAPARRAKIQGLKGLKNAEGVAPIELNGKSLILFVSDDGNKEENETGNLLLIEYDQLSIR